MAGKHQIVICCIDFAIISTVLTVGAVILHEEAQCTCNSSVCYWPMSKNALKNTFLI